MYPQLNYYENCSNYLYMHGLIEGYMGRAFSPIKLDSIYHILHSFFIRLESLVFDYTRKNSVSVTLDSIER